MVNYRYSVLGHENNSEKDGSHLHVKYLKRTSVTTTGSYSRSLAFFQLGVDNVSSDYSFLRWIAYFDECLFHISGFANTQNPLTWFRTPKGDSTTWINHPESKSLVCYALQWCGMSKTILIMNSQKSQLSPKAGTLTLGQDLKNSHKMSFSSRIKAPLHVTHATRSTLDEMFPNSWNERYEPTGWPAKSPGPASLDLTNL